MESSRPFVQWMMDAEQFEVIARFIDIDRNFNQIQQRNENLQKKVKDVESKLRSAVNSKNAAIEDNNACKGGVSKVVDRIQTIITVKFPGLQEQQVDQGHVAQYDPITIPEEMRILNMLRDDLESITNDIPF